MLQFLSSFGDKIRTVLNKIPLIFSFNASSDKMITEDNAFVSVINLTKLMLERDTKISKYIENKISVKNVTTFYQLAKLYKLKSAAETTRSYIQCCFPMVVESQNFLELDYNIVVQILTSSGLSVQSELEVFNAASSWLQHNSKDRSKFAKQLLLTVRLPLLSDHALNKSFYNTSSLFTENNECVEVLKEILVRKKKLFHNKSKSYYINRYCNQNNFNILICDGSQREESFDNNANYVDESNLNYVKVLPSLREERHGFEAVYLKGEVYAFGGYVEDINEEVVPVMSVEKYSPSTNAWNKVADMYDYRMDFCCCPFMNNTFIIGGYFNEEDGNSIDTNSCLQFDTKDSNWKKVSGMNESRAAAACTVFEGRIIVSGGHIQGIHNNSKTVESYDVMADTWSSMPNMISSKSYHRLVAVKSKLFVIGFDTDTSEVFDSICKKFTTFKTPLNFVSGKAVPIGNKILIIQWETQEEEIQDNTRLIVCYDVDKNEWSKESWETTKDLDGFTCVTFPRL